MIGKKDKNLSFLFVMICLFEASIVMKWVKLPAATLGIPMWVLLHLLSTLLPTYLPGNVPRREVKYGQSAWASASMW